MSTKVSFRAVESLQGDSTKREKMSFFQITLREMQRESNQGDGTYIIAISVIHSAARLPESSFNLLITLTK